MTQTHSGGCLCGAIRFEASADPIETGYCHCRLCQLSTGAPTLAYASFPVASFRYTAGTPSQFASSPRAAREFCGICGTQIAGRASANPIVVDVNVGALDEPTRYPPAMHIYCTTAIPWLRFADELPRYDGAAPLPRT